MLHQGRFFSYDAFTTGVLVLLKTFKNVIAISCSTPTFSDLLVNVQCDGAVRAYRSSTPFLSVDDIIQFFSYQSK